MREKNLKRNCWPLAMIEEVKVSSDNLVRSARIKVIRPKEHSSVTFYERPICELILLIKNPNSSVDP